MTSDSSEMPTPPDEQPAAPRGLLKKLLALLSDASVYGVSSMLSQVISFLLLPLFTRYLGKDDYGVIAMLAIVAMLFGPLANLGMTNAIFRRYNQAPDDRARRAVLGTGLLSVVLGSLAWLVISLLFADWIAEDFVGDKNATLLVRIALVSAAFNTVGQVPNITLRALRRSKTAASLNLANVVITLAATIVFVVALGMGVKGWILGTLLADVLFLALAIACTRGLYDLRLDRKVWRSMIAYGLPFLPHRLQAVALAQFGQYMVREMLGLGEAGIYSVATKFALPVGLIVNAIQEAWIPFKFQVHAQEADARPFFRSIFTYYFAGVSYLWVGVSLWGFEVVRLMTAAEFHAAAVLVPVLALLRVAQGFYFMMGTGLELSERTGVYPLISLTGLATVVAGAFLLVDPLGAMGAAVANVLCWLVMAGVMYVLAQRRLKIDYDWSTIACFTLLSAGCVGVSYAIQPCSPWTRLAVDAAISLAYPLVAMVLLIRSPVERDRMQILFMKFHALRTSRARGAT